LGAIDTILFIGGLKEDDFDPRPWLVFTRIFRFLHWTFADRAEPEPGARHTDWIVAGEEVLAREEPEAWALAMR